MLTDDLLTYADVCWRMLTGALLATLRDELVGSDAFARYLSALTGLEVCVCVCVCVCMCVYLSLSTIVCLYPYLLSIYPSIHITF